MITAIPARPSRPVRRVPALALLGLALGAAAPARAQTPVQDFLKQARNALDTEKYRDAANYAGKVLQLEASASRAQIVEALQIRAVALMPESDPRARQPDSSAAALSRLVAMGLDIDLPRDLKWSELDAMLKRARDTTYAIGVRLPDEEKIVGAEGAWRIEARANRPSMIRAFARSAQSRSAAPILLDSLSGVSGTLDLPAIRNGAPVLTSGKYVLTVEAVDTASGQTRALSYNIEVDAPRITPVEIPHPDSVRGLKDPRRPPVGNRALVAGVALGATTMAFASVINAQSPAASGADSRGMAIGVGLALGAIAAMKLDKGAEDPLIVQENEKLKQEHMKLIAERKEAQRKLLADHTVTVKANKEAF